MNLELLDPFGRQVPDRIDATLQLPSQVKSGAATACAFNRRGTYLAVGYADGSVAIFCTLNRTVSAIYPGATNSTNGVGSISWSRRSRRLLVGAVGDTHIKLIDTTHPAGPEAAAERLANLSKSAAGVAGKDSSNAADTERMMADTSERSSSPLSSDPASQQQHGIVLPHHTISHTEKTSFRDMESPYVIYVKESRRMGGPNPTPSVTIQSYKQPKQFSALDIPLPEQLGHALEIHAGGHHGLAVCGSDDGDGELYLFHVDDASFCEADPTRKCQWTRLLPGYNDIVCATFAGTPHNNHSIYAVRSHEILLVHTGAEHATAPAPHQRIATDCAAPWHLIRHQKQLLLNGADGILRLYDTTATSNHRGGAVQFQDRVTKTTFADAAISGDGEHVVGVANLDNLYELYIWNALSGILVDKLTSQQSARLSSVQWHPVRAAVCVAACADGIVDVWGPRINWTAFAPDFQALPENVEYIEREDEFDLDGETGMLINTKKTESLEDTVVDVLSIDPVPVFASDSEDEREVFEFETRVKNIIAARGEGKKGRNFNSGDD